MSQTQILRCPVCAGLVEPAFNVDGRDEPRDWMPCLCAHCGEIATFEHTAPGGLRRPTSLDWKAWHADPTLTRQLAVAVRAGQRLKKTTDMKETRTMKTANKAYCEFCRVPVDVTATGTYQFVKGWIGNRAGGGANDVRLKQRESRWACRPCVDLRSDGAENQGSLIG